MVLGKIQQKLIKASSHFIIDFKIHRSEGIPNTILKSYFKLFLTVHGSILFKNFSTSVGTKRFTFVNQDQKFAC